jgi:hypothetical protein
MAQHPTFQIDYWPEGFDEEEFGEVSWICLKHGNMLYAVEEANTFASKTKIEPRFQRCINWGRMEGLGVVVISPRCSNLHNDCIAQANHVFLFKTQLPNDLQWLGGFVPPDALKELPTLEEHEKGNSSFIYWNRREWRICEPVSISPNPIPDRNIQDESEHSGEVEEVRVSGGAEDESLDT